MNVLLIFGGLFLICGVVMLVLPIHMQMTGLVLLLLGAAQAFSWLLMRRPAHWKQTLISVLVVLAASGVVCLMAAMNIITTSGQSDWKRAETSEYAVVLGAMVHESGRPSRILQTRLNAALEFMEQNPDAMVIVSGGQGDQEPTTEAQCMFDTLVEMGADPERILLEDRSTDTSENILFSKEIMDGRGGTSQPVTLITSEFHQRRAAFIAAGLDVDTCPVSAKTPWFYRVNYTLREVFAFVKAFLQH